MFFTKINFENQACFIKIKGPNLNWYFFINQLQKMKETIIQKKIRKRLRRGNKKSGHSNKLSLLQIARRINKGFIWKNELMTYISIFRKVNFRRNIHNFKKNSKAQSTASRNLKVYNPRFH